MKRQQFLKELRKRAKARHLDMAVDTKLGKGSHIRVTVGGSKTTIKDGDLSPAYMKLVRKQLGLEEED